MHYRTINLRSCTFPRGHLLCWPGVHAGRVCDGERRPAPAGAQLRGTAVPLHQRNLPKQVGHGRAMAEATRTCLPQRMRNRCRARTRTMWGCIHVEPLCAAATSSATRACQVHLAASLRPARIDGWHRCVGPAGRLGGHCGGAHAWSRGGALHVLPSPHGACTWRVAGPGPLRMMPRTPQLLLSMLLLLRRMQILVSGLGRSSGGGAGAAAAGCAAGTAGHSRAGAE